MQVTAQIGFVDAAIVERFDCYEGTSAKAKLSKDLYVQGVNFFARKPERHPVKTEAAASNMPR
ncbi:MAG TPA: hypothetical protein VIH18_10360 [Candidatus Binatia bacterium]